ncbi:hypothetical protein SAMN05216324_12410 [Chryseobacterium limigenitum]|uniref:Uncharacterized protein n=1 Tax=Chryseobacterium limigenitum TaxID=1612149 RepID=A0A1K2IWN8_9FLAO|nr:hypothetical protein SAMN05216324_12410 [Chryseobacterium limigenitum]
MPLNNTIVRIRFVHHVDESSDLNNATLQAYAYGDFTVVGRGIANPIHFVDVQIKGYDGLARTISSTATSISWDTTGTSTALGTSTITLNQTTGELRITNGNPLVFSYMFEILGGM